MHNYHYAFHSHSRRRWNLCFNHCIIKRITNERWQTMCATRYTLCTHVIHSLIHSLMHTFIHWWHRIKSTIHKWWVSEGVNTEYSSFICHINLCVCKFHSFRVNVNSDKQRSLMRMIGWSVSRQGWQKSFAAVLH